MPKQLDSDAETWQLLGEHLVEPGVADRRAAVLLRDVQAQQALPAELQPGALATELVVGDVLLLVAAARCRGSTKARQVTRKDS